MNLFGAYDPGYGGNVTSQNFAYTSGQWGIDPSLRTPPWDAPYRPDGPNAPSAYTAYRTPGFLGAVSNLVSPFRRDPVWGSPNDYNNASYHSLATKPFDSSAWVGQNVVTPLASAIVAQRLFGGMGTSMGRGLFGGVAEGLGASSTGWLARGAAGFGGLAGGALLPLAMGQAMYQGINYGAFRSYTSSIATGESLRRATGNISYGGDYGDPFTGRGIGAAQSARIGTQIDRAAVRDITFSADQYHEIARSSAQYGLLDNMNGTQITERVKGLAQQVKLILAISKDPSIQNALQELAKLKMGGASVAGGINSVAASAYSRIAANASAAGITVQEMMSKVGTQGQYMYQAAGLTPYMGQIAASNIYSGFASAHRAGILSDAQLARMGGIEGATQSVIGAQIASTQTTFGRMQAFNQYLAGGQRGGSIVDTVSRFGNVASRDPVSAMGRMLLRGNEASSLMLEADNGTGPEEQAYQLLRNQGIKPQGRDGKYSADQLAAALSSLGMSPDQVVAYVQNRSSQTNPLAAGQRRAGIIAQERDATLSAVSQNMGYNSVVGSIGRAFNKSINYLGDVASDEMGHPVAEARGRFEEIVQNVGNKILYGSTFTRNDEVGTNYKVDVKKAMDSSGVSVMSMSMTGSNTYDFFNQLNKDASKKGEMGELARKILSKDTPADEKKKAIIEYGRKIGGREGRSINRGLESDPALIEAIQKGLNDKTVSFTKSSSSQSDESQLVSSANGDTAYENLQIMGQAQELLFTVGSEGKAYASEGLDLLKDPKYKQLADALGRDSDKSASYRLNKIRELAAKSFAGGYGRSGFMAANMASVDDVLSGKVSVDAITKDADTKAKLLAAIKKKDRGAISKILLDRTAGMAGGVRGDGLNLPSGQSLSEIANETKGIRDSALGLTAEGGTSKSKFDLILEDIAKFVSPGQGAGDASAKMDQAGDKMLEAAKIFQQVMQRGGAQVPSGTVMDPNRNNRMNYRQ